MTYKRLVAFEDFMFEVWDYKANRPSMVYRPNLIAYSIADAPLL